MKEIKLSIDPKILALIIIAVLAILLIPGKTVSRTVQVPYETTESYTVRESRGSTCVEKNWLGNCINYQNLYENVPKTRTVTKMRTDTIYYRVNKWFGFKLPWSEERRVRGK